MDSTSKAPEPFIQDSRLPCTSVVSRRNLTHTGPYIRAPIERNSPQGFGKHSRYNGVSGVAVHNDRLYVVDTAGGQVEVFKFQVQ